MAPMCVCVYERLLHYSVCKNEIRCLVWLKRGVLFLSYFLLLSAILGIWIFFGAAEGR